MSNCFKVYHMIFFKDNVLFTVVEMITSAVLAIVLKMSISLNSSIMMFKSIF